MLQTHFKPFLTRNFLPPKRPIGRSCTGDKDLGESLERTTALCYHVAADEPSKENVTAEAVAERCPCIRFRRLNDLIPQALFKLVLTTGHQPDVGAEPK